MKKNGLIAEFKEFISKGSVFDMAVGIIVGGAFTTIVNSLVNDVVMPCLTCVTGGTDFSGLNFTLKGEGESAVVLNLGSFIGAIINFLLIALVIFFLVKGINKLRDLKKAPEEEPAAPTTKKCPYCFEEIPIEATRCPHCTSELEK